MCEEDFGEHNYMRWHQQFWRRETIFWYQTFEDASECTRLQRLDQLLSSSCDFLPFLVCTHRLNSCVDTQLWGHLLNSRLSRFLHWFAVRNQICAGVVSAKLTTSNKASFVRFMKWHVYKWWSPLNKSRYMGEMCSRSIECEAFSSWNGLEILTFSARDWVGKMLNGVLRDEEHVFLVSRM